MNDDFLEDGLDEELFESPISKHMMCSICNGVLVAATSCPSGHNFCLKCIQKWVANSPSCPVDRKPFHASSFGTNLLARNLISEMRLKCPKHCSWSGSVESLFASHVSECPNAITSCKFAPNCPHRLKRCEMATHELTCEFRPLTCEYCGEHLSSRANAAQHYESLCPEMLVSCPSNDPSCPQFRRADLRAHIDSECAFTNVPCPFSIHACAHVTQRGQLQRHLSTEVTQHLLLLSSSFVHVSNELQRSKDFNQDLLTQMDGLREETHNAKKRAKEAMDAVNELRQLFKNSSLSPSKASPFSSPSLPQRPATAAAAAAAASPSRPQSALSSQRLLQERVLENKRAIVASVRARKDELDRVRPQSARPSSSSASSSWPSSSRSAHIAASSSSSSSSSSQRIVFKDYEQEDGGIPEEYPYEIDLNALAAEVSSIFPHRPNE